LIGIMFLCDMLQAQEYAFRSYTVHDGLISNYVTAMKQDSRGYLWIGTDEGVSIFDGTSFRNIRPPQKELWGYVNAFHESPNDAGVMWIATNGGGIIRYAEGGYTQKFIDTVLAANRVNDLYEDRSGILWFTTDNGFYSMNAGAVRYIPLPATHSRFLIQIVPVGEHLFWISSPYGIISYHTKSGEIQQVLPMELSGTNGQIFPMPGTGRTVVITLHALKVFREGRIVQTLPLPNGSYGNGALDSSGNLWIGGTTRVLLLRMEQGAFQIQSTFRTTNGLPVNDVSAIESDRENNIWFGTAGKGIARLQDPENMRFRMENLTSRGTSDHLQRIWVPTSEGTYLLSKTRDRSWSSTRITFPGGRIPIAFQSAGRDRLWCTMYGGDLSEFRVRTGSHGAVTISHLRTLNAQNGFPALYTIVLFKDSKGFLWCAQQSQGVVIVDPHSPSVVKQVFSSFPGVPHMTVSAFGETTDGHVFAGGIGSNALLEFAWVNGSYQYRTAHRYDSLISQYGIRSLTGSPDGSLWIGTRYDGIVRKQPDGTVRSYTFADGLHSLQILSLFSDAKALWIGTQSGLEYVPDIASPRFIQSTELTRSPIYTVGAYADRTVWAMSRYEVTVNDPGTLIAKTPPPPIYLTQFDVNGISRPLRSSQEFIRNDMLSCSFAYAAVTLKGNIDVKYQYRLTGLHDNWQNLTPERSVTFANLGAGEYTFSVRAVLNHGEQVTDPVEHSFIIVPALWDRWWFTPLVLSVLLSVLAGVYVLRVRQKFAVEKVRISIAADLHDDIGSVLARIANLADIMVMYGSQQRPAAVRKKSVKRSLPEENARTIAELSRELMEKMSDVVWSVDPDNDDPKKLTERLQTYCTELAEHHRLKVNFSADGVYEGRSIDPQKTRATLLIVKESLANILTHAQAKKIDLSVEIMPKRWSITIADDGVGFNEDELPRVNGIYNMRSRAAACGGSVQVTSSAGNGTTIRLEIPL
jgi:ligand-binding sensor domain-containing protein/two-component sensor histidine kinase